ncbi:hypothetical protein N0V94_005390 [Neodidymelliopsis sp. IMI 364377]|nr:hypothetical protein N0V94_005390 [Neodidymelliopsis sp. IMI 364377]
MGKNRKRGKRTKSTLPSHLRVALREERQANKYDPGEEDVGAVLGSIEEQAKAFEQELSEVLPAAPSDRSVTRSPSPERADIVSESDREISWSPSPERGDQVAAVQPIFDNEDAPRSPSHAETAEDAEGQVEDEEELSEGSQNIEEDEVSSSDESGDVDNEVYCLCICRISSNKYVPVDEAPPGADIAARRVLYDNARKTEGRELARRYEANANPPFRFTEIEATCHKRHSFEPTDYTNDKVRNQMGKDLRAYFQKKRGKKVVVLVRAIDGLTVDKATMQKFCTMIKDFGVRAEIVIQYNKVFDEIRPHRLENYKGLGGIIRFTPTDFLDHVNKTRHSVEIHKVVSIWRYLASTKVRGLGIHDRNNLLPKTAMQPLEGSMASAVR